MFLKDNETEDQIVGREKPKSFLIPVRNTDLPIEIPLRRRKKPHDIDDFEVIDDLQLDDKRKLSVLNYYDFRRKKPLKFLMTREIARYFDRETYLKVSLKEMIIFIGFLIVLCLLSFSTASPAMFYYSKVMSRLFVNTIFTTSNDQKINLHGINSIDDIWPYIESVALNNFYWEFWYSRYDRASVMDTEDDSNILYENKLIGVPRMRQLRVRNNSCEVLPEFKSKFSACYDLYTVGNEDKEPFGLLDNSTAWSYTKESDLGSHRYTTDIATYSGGGYYFDLNTTYPLSKEGIEKLKDNIWLDRGTRVLFIDFTTYNANVNLFCIVKLIFEVPPTGGVLPSFEFYTQKLIHYVETWDYVLLAFQCIFAIYFIFYTVEELYEMTYFKWQYVKRFWNWLDLIVLLLCFAVISLNIYMFVNVKNTLEQLIKMKDSHPVFDDLTNGQTMFNVALSILIFLSWIKLLKYLSINHSMYQIQTTLTRASTDIVNFSVIFVAMFIAFAQFGLLKFGNEVEDFRTFHESVFALLRTVVGDFNYKAIERVDRIFGPIYFFLFIFFIFFILVNMFLAIVIQTYSEVRSEINAGGIKTHLSDLISKFFNNVLRKIGCSKFADSREKKAEESFARSTYQDIRNLLRRCGFTELEMDLFFAKYEITEDRLISPEEMRKILVSLEDLPARDHGGSQTTEGLNVTNDLMKERVITIEEAVLKANTKIDIILNKLDSMPPIRMTRRR